MSETRINEISNKIRETNKEICEATRKAKEPYLGGLELLREEKKELEKKERLAKKEKMEKRIPKLTELFRIIMKINAAGIWQCDLDLSSYVQWMSVTVREREFTH